jgi:hypothetical protein
VNFGTAQALLVNGSLAALTRRMADWPAMRLGREWTLQRSQSRLVAANMPATAVGSNGMCNDGIRSCAYLSFSVCAVFQQRIASANIACCLFTM